jgi:hypothetical protein
MTESIIDMADFDRLEAEPLLFQSGYLTVKEVLPKTAPAIYLLGMPNFEVREAFNLHVLAAFTESSHTKAKSARIEIEEALREGDLRKFLAILRSLFASIPYNLHVNAEAYYHSIFYAVMSVLGFDIDAEASVSKGRIDAALELNDKVYVMEFKYKGCKPDASAEEKQGLLNGALNEAMAQIESKGYGKKYAGSGKAIYHAAFAFLGRDDIEMKCRQKLIDDNERKYGEEIRAKYGNDAIDRSNAKVNGMTDEQHAEVERLSLEVNETIKAAFEQGDPSGSLAQKACELHKKWLCYFWDNYSKEAHLSVTQMYVDDPRFTAYYDKICAQL